ncbi:hypothetical protein GGR56DRAFT_617041 [Xylariaceae sp. FL0804]|nr:hypothetical protein GGR56DRAFT_617041 [Xylariaceae sp. FL0804]
MSFLLYSPSPTSQVGLRALCRGAGKLLNAASATRPFSSSRSPIVKPCLDYSSRHTARPRRPFRDRGPLYLLPRTQIRTIFGEKIVTEYIMIPPTYEDALGLPFRKQDLSEQEAREIFGRPIDVSEANQLLKILHGRRVAGTLEDPKLAVNTARFTVSDKTLGLAYLRANIEVDEVISAGLRAEDELEVIEKRIRKRIEDEEKGIEPSPEALEEPVEEVPTGRLPPKPGSDSPYGISNWDIGRAENIRKRKEKEAKWEEERLKREAENPGSTLSLAQLEERANKIWTEEELHQKSLEVYRRAPEWVQTYYFGATSDIEAPPDMTHWERISPMLAMSVVICMVCAAVFYLYRPPARSARLWPDVPPAAATCIGLIMVNAAVYAAWKMPPCWKWLNMYFLLSVGVPRAPQVLGAMFSHQKFRHMLVNIVPLYFMGTALCDEIGRGKFLAIYVASGTLSMLGSHVWYTLTGRLLLTTLGASGAVFGVAAAYFWLHRFEEFKILGLPPDPYRAPQGLVLLALIFASQLVPLAKSMPIEVTKVDTANHIAGALAGLVGAGLLTAYRERLARRREERLKTMPEVLDKHVSAPQPRQPPPATTTTTTTTATTVVAPDTRDSQAAAATEIDSAASAATEIKSSVWS